MTPENGPLLDVRDLVVPAGRRRLHHDRAPAVNGVSLQVRRGETFGVVGESGSGASTLGQAICGLVRPTAGRILLRGTELRGRDTAVRLLPPDVARAGRRTARSLLESEMPGSDDGSLRALAASVGLPVAALDDRPHELSDAHRRRLDVARAVCTAPELVVIDDPVAGLDVTVAAQVLDLLVELKARLGLTYLVIARDLGVVRHLSDRVGVMYLGGMVEEAPARALYRSPRHPYTRALLSAVPVPDPEVEDRRERILLAGDLPSTTAIPHGCPFHPRCPWRRPDRCTDERPAWRDFAGPGHRVACHHVEEISAER